MGDRTALAERTDDRGGSPRLSRRAFLRTATVGGAAGAVVASGILSAPPAGAADTSYVPADPDLHLLRRATYGATPGMLEGIGRQGRNVWLDRQLNPASIDDRACDELIARFFPRLKWTIPQVNRDLVDFSWDLMFELGAATIARAAWSKRQLFEVMVDFWSNLLNVTNPSDNVWDNRHDYDRLVIRKHALGRYEDMLIASAKHPAMLRYLNNAESHKWSPNENYGRELLELHTVGVEAGYTEQHMRHSALIMTGFTVNWDDGTFVYKPSWHHTGPVTVMDFTRANGAADGQDMAIAYLRYLANHPVTARRIATKLCERFVSDTAQPALVDRLAQLYLDNGTAIAPVLRALFRSPEFADAIGEKVRRPTEDVMATIRILGIKPGDSKAGLRDLYWMIESLGHAPLAWSQPDGYPDFADAWRSAGGLVGRWNATMALAAHWWPDKIVRPPLRDLLPRKLPATHGKLVDVLSRRLVFRTLAPAHRSAVLEFLDVNDATPLAKDSAAVKWRFASLVALILGSPYHQIR
ncbi:MAG: DUF1800 domain-containing protein [Actinomycetota bacterium]